jgi:hypothetical protein
MKSGAVERAWNQELLKELAARTGSSWKVQTFDAAVNTTLQQINVVATFV